MFQPASLKGISPTPFDERIRNRYFILYIVIIIGSLIPFIFLEHLLIILFWKHPYYFIFLILLPFNLILSIYVIQISSLLIAKLFLIIINLFHAPREGNFKRDIKDKNYLFWNLRNIVKKFPLFIIATNPFPWFKHRFTLRFFGVQIGKKTLSDNCWISSEFVKIGSNVIIGMGTVILTFIIEQDNFIIKKVIIEDDVSIGAKCVILPGTKIEKGAKLSAYSYTEKDSILKKHMVYGGHPAKLANKNGEDL